MNFGNVVFQRASLTGIVLLIVGAAGLVLLVIYEYRAENPVVSVRSFKYKEFRIAWICHFLFTMYVVTASAYIVLYGQNVMKVSATVSSTISMPQTICSAVLASPYLQTTMPREHYGVAQGMIAFGGSAGGTVCGAVAGAFLNSGAPMENSLGKIYLVFGICLLVVFVMGLTDVRGRSAK